MSKHKTARRRPIRVNGRFATALDTAEVLGVPKARADFLIKLAKQSLSAATIRRAKNGTQAEFKLNRTKTTAAPVELAAKKKPGSMHGKFTVKKAKIKR